MLVVVELKGSANIHIVRGIKGLMTHLFTHLCVYLRMIGMLVPPLAT